MLIRLVSFAECALSWMTAGDGPEVSTQTEPLGPGASARGVALEDLHGRLLEHEALALRIDAVDGSRRRAGNPDRRSTHHDRAWIYERNDVHYIAGARIDLDQRVGRCAAIRRRGRSLEPDAAARPAGNGRSGD